MNRYMVRLRLLVSLVRITLNACGKKAVVVNMAANGPKFKYSIALLVRFYLSCLLRGKYNSKIVPKNAGLAYL